MLSLMGGVRKNGLLVVIVLILIIISIPLRGSRELKEDRSSSSGGSKAVILGRGPVPPSRASPCTHIGQGDGHCNITSPDHI